MSDWVNIRKDKQHIARERQKARKLKQSNWWKNLLAEGKCHYCNGVFEPAELTMDHIVPVSRGGKSNKGNIVVCCKDCNNEKKYLTPAEMILKKLRNQDQE